MRFVFALLAIITTLGSVAADDNSTKKMVEACGLWADAGQDYGGNTVLEWAQVHRAITILFEGHDHTLTCHFRDVQDEIPEVVALEKGAIQLSPTDVRTLNRVIWRHFVPAT